MEMEMESAHYFDFAGARVLKYDFQMEMVSPERAAAPAPQRPSTTKLQQPSR